MKNYQRELKIKRKMAQHAGKGGFESTPGISQKDLGIIYDFFLPKHYETYPHIIALKIEYDIRYYSAIKAMLFYMLCNNTR